MVLDRYANLAFIKSPKISGNSVHCLHCLFTNLFTVEFPFPATTGLFFYKIEICCLLSLNKDIMECIRNQTNPTYF